MARSFLKDIWGGLRILANNDVWQGADTGAPTSGTSGTGVGIAGSGSIYTRTSNGVRYANTNTKASPTWTIIPTASSPSFTTPNIGVATGTSLAVTGLLTSSSPTAGIGYATGAGGTVTQGSSRTTTVVLNTICGNIVLFSAAGSATPFSFTMTNSAIAVGDVVVISQKSGTDKYTTQVVTATGAGSCQITLANASGTTTEQPVFNFVVIKAVAA